MAYSLNYQRMTVLKSDICHNFHLTEGMCVSPNFGGSEMSCLCVGIGGTEENWL